MHPLKGVVKSKTKTSEIFISCKFGTLNINLSEVVLLRHIPLQITVFGKKRLRNLLNASQRRVNKNSLT